MDPNTNQTNPQSSPAPVPPAPEPYQNLITQKLKNIAVNLFNKFYANKKIFWPVTGFFGLVFLIIIMGLLFGNKKNSNIISPKITPTPFILSTPIASPSAGILGASGEKLIQLKTQIDNLDVRQSRLQPPTLNFDVKF